MKLFKKIKKENGRRHIYFCGVKIFSYKGHLKTSSNIILGNSNRIYAIKNGKKYPIKKVYADFSIKGKDNEIIFDCNHQDNILDKVPEGLHLHITGNRNTVIIEYPIKINNVEINMYDDENLFSIKRTEHPFANALFSLERGSSVRIGKSCEIGNGNLFVVANNCFHEKHSLTIGDYVHIARDVIIRTSDGQAILDPKTNQAVNEPKDVHIGNHCWIMTRSMIVKGACLPDNTAVAPYSFVNKAFREEYTLLAGVPAKILKTNFKWDVLPYAKYMDKHYKKED